MSVRFKRVSLLTLVVAPLAIAGSLVGYSPISCGCVDPWVSLAFGLDLPSDDWKSITPGKVQAAFDRKYRGTQISLAKLPFADEIDECVSASPALFRCTYWLWQKGSMKKGLEVTISIGAKSEFESAHVLEVDARNE